MGGIWTGGQLYSGKWKYVHYWIFDFSLECNVKPILRDLKHRFFVKTLFAG
jgi:hypothetical protein